jgi:alpha-1,3-rhamnosyl/mannosyltransferase
VALFHSVDAAVLPWGAGCPIVSTSHDVIPLMGEAAGGAAGPLRLTSRRRRLRRSYGRAAHLIAVSEVTRQDIVRELGIPPERISVVHHGVDSRQFSPGADPGERERLRRAFGLPERWFLCVGSDHRRKNHGRLFQAWAESAGQLPEGLVIVGRALYRRSLQRLEAEAKRRGLSGGFRWLDRIDDGTLPALYRQATAAVAPSLYEGFGLTLLEAMACGTPIAGAANGAYREVGGDAVLYFDPFDTQEIRRALCRLSNEAVLRESLRARGLVRATHWSWERSANETLAVYRAVLAGQVA